MKTQKNIIIGERMIVPNHCSQNVAFGIWYRGIIPHRNNYTGSFFMVLSTLHQKTWTILTYTKQGCVKVTNPYISQLWWWMKVEGNLWLRWQKLRKIDCEHINNSKRANNQYSHQSLCRVICNEIASPNNIFFVSHWRSTSKRCRISTTQQKQRLYHSLFTVPQL